MAVTKSSQPSRVRFPVLLSCGRRVHWTLQRYARVMGVGGAPSGPMWTLTDHDGYERGLESNWISSVAAARQIVSNYGGTCLLS